MLWRQRKPVSPRAILGDFLFASELNALEFAAEPRADLRQGNGQIQMLRDAAGHDAFLLDALAAATLSSARG